MSDVRAKAGSACGVTCLADRAAGKALLEDLGHPEGRVDILVTNLAWFCEESYRKALCKSVAGNAAVRVLTLDPQSVFVSYRATQLGLQTSRFRNEMDRSLDKLHTALFEAWHGAKGSGPENDGYPNFEIRTYDDFPTQITVTVNDKVYVSTVARASRSRRLCTFVCGVSDPGVERSFLFHFDTLWVIAKPYRPYTPSK